MKYSKEVAKKIAKTYCILFQEIEHSDDLKKYGLTLAEYDNARFSSIDLFDKGRTSTIMENVAKFFERNGFYVQNTPNGISYQISCWEGE